MVSRGPRHTHSQTKHVSRSARLPNTHAYKPNPLRNAKRLSANGYPNHAERYSNIINRQLSISTPVPQHGADRTRAGAEYMLSPTPAREKSISYTVCSCGEPREPHLPPVNKSIITDPHVVNTSVSVPGWSRATISRDRTWTHVPLGVALNLCKLLGMEGWPPLPHRLQST